LGTVSTGCARPNEDTAHSAVAHAPPSADSVHPWQQPPLPFGTEEVRWNMNSATPPVGGPGFLDCARGGLAKNAVFSFAGLRDGGILCPMVVDESDTFGRMGTASGQSDAVLGEAMLGGGANTSSTSGGGADRTDVSDGGAAGSVHSHGLRRFMAWLASRASHVEKRSWPRQSGAGS